MKTTFSFGSLLLLVLATASCSKDGNPPGPGPGPVGTKIEHTGTAQLSTARKGLKGAGAGNKILFAGGIYSLSHPDAVDIYDVSTNSWAKSSLKVPRVDHAVASAGNKILVAGGRAFYNGLSATNSVEIYDVSTGKWALETLSSPRIFLAAASLQDKVFFAGGSTPDKDGICCIVTRKVDIYDISTGNWSYAELSDARSEVGIAASGNKILFAGGAGHSNQTGGYFSSRVDIYDISTGKWSTAELSEARSHPYAAAAGNKILFAGGRKSNLGSGESKVVDIYNVATGTWSTTTLSVDREGVSIAAIGNKIMIAGGHSSESGHLNSVDVYDAATDKWEKLQLSEARMDAAAAAAGNKLLVAGGISESNFSKTVDIFTLSN